MTTGGRLRSVRPSPVWAVPRSTTPPEPTPMGPTLPKLLLAAATATAMSAELGQNRAAAQTTTVNGTSLVLKSTNSNVINTNGYVGTYITLAAPGTVSLSVSAFAAS